MNDLTDLVAGILEAEHVAPDAPTTRRRQVLGRALEGSSSWPIEPVPVGDWQEYEHRARQRMVRWEPPTGPAPSTDVDWFADQLDARGIRGLRVRVEEPAMCGDLASRRFVVPVGHRVELEVGAFVEHPSRSGWAWRWPLRVGVLAGPDSAEHVDAIRGGGDYANLYEAFETDGHDECEFLVLPAGVERPDVCPAPVVVIVGEWPGASGPDGPEWPFERGAAAVVVSPPTSPDWIEQFVIELSHDLPIDMALRRAQPDSVLVADPSFVQETTVRQWGNRLVDRLERLGGHRVVPRLREVILGSFDSEQGNTADIAAASVAVADDGIDVAVPTRGPSAAMTPDESGVRDQRRLQSIVRVHEPGHKKTVADRFVPGADHDIRICIAAERREGAAAARVPFRHPDPGRDVKLQVSIIVAGRRIKRTLTLPAMADSRWTIAAPFHVPDDAAAFRIDIEVAHSKRVFQSATLTGSPFALVVDEAPLSDLDDREAASTAITLVDGPSDAPVVIDLDRDAGDVDAERVKAATQRLRKELLSAFVAPPPDLASAAGTLTRLAVRGSTLYRALAGASRSYHDRDAWIHVNAFTTRDVPVELVYTHPMPKRDDEVPICPEALAGASACGGACASRRSADVVCPFGFWATSKILERRNHVPSRSTTIPAPSRRVRPLASSAVGVSLEASVADGTATSRITDALSSAVASAKVADSWQELELIAEQYPTLVVLVTHTVVPEGGAARDRDLDVALELNGDLRKIHRIDDAAVNPGCREPGPIVFALGCDTNLLVASFTDLVRNLQAANAEVVLSSISPIPGQGVADFLERFLPILTTELGRGGTHRFGTAMLAARQATMAAGDLMALALTAVGDADVELVG